MTPGPTDTQRTISEAEDARAADFARGLLGRFGPTPRVRRVLPELAAALGTEKLRAGLLLEVALRCPASGRFAAAQRDAAATLDDETRRGEVPSALAPRP